MDGFLPDLMHDAKGSQGATHPFSSQVCCEEVVPIAALYPFENKQRVVLEVS